MYQAYPAITMVVNAAAAAAAAAAAGDVINHGKHQFWGVPNMHYHQGMAAGENTLNAVCARVVMRGIAANGGK
jgi:Spy/CpxP family protein refolding chaperone